VRLIVTRPATQAAAWVPALQALGCDARALPLIAIEALADSAPLRAAWLALPRYALVMFVSANAVRHFFAAATGPWPAAPRAGATGPGTAAALRAAGVPPAALVEPVASATRFDSEALWAQLAHEDWVGRRALVVRGEDGRDWLAETLRGRGASVDFVAAYRRLAPQPDAPGRALLVQALAEPASHLWLFSSSEAVANLRLLAPGADWSCGAALATHPRIAAAARALGFLRVELTAPTPEAVAQAAAAGPSIQSSTP
jgi:uroporphyrinogen-III synthase